MNVSSTALLVLVPSSLSFLHRYYTGTTPVLYRYYTGTYTCTGTSLSILPYLKSQTVFVRPSVRPCVTLSSRSRTSYGSATGTSRC